MSVEGSSLTSDALLDCISHVCRRESNPKAEQADPWSFAPANPTTLRRAHLQLQATGKRTLDDDDTFDTNLLLGVVGQDAEDNERQWLCTFYLAYSTWEGRVIFWDQIVPLLESPSEASDLIKLMTTPTKPQPLFARLVAKIGQALHCRRIVWRHRGDNPLPLYKGVVPVETLEGWLTLYWDVADMQAFAPYHKLAVDTGDATDGVQLSMQDAFVAALAQAKHDTFRLRLATAGDVPVIDRLVLGLAEFEGEPESYKLSKEQLKHDGFAGRPMYYCILMDDKATKDYTCAMALCYVACDLSGGRFLYLEDLFVEAAYRGKGGGKLVMSTLALVAQSLRCTKAVWQALDWNTPALTFYNSLGARVQEGLITSRFAGQAMDKFAELPLMEGLVG